MKFLARTYQMLLLPFFFFRNSWLQVRTRHIHWISFHSNFPPPLSSLIFFLIFYRLFFFHWSLSLSFIISFLPFLPLFGPLSRGCRIHRLYLCRRVRLTQRVSCIWHETIWWWGSSNAGSLGSAEYPFITIAPRWTLAQSGSTWEGPMYGLNRTKLCTYAKYNCLK